MYLDLVTSRQKEVTVIIDFISINSVEMCRAISTIQMNFIPVIVNSLLPISLAF